MPLSIERDGQPFGRPSLRISVASCRAFSIELSTTIKQVYLKLEHSLAVGLRIGDVLAFERLSIPGAFKAIARI